MFRSMYPLHFDVKDIHIRIHIIFHENFTQKTRSTASIYILQGNSTAAATVGTDDELCCIRYACQLLLMRTRARRAYCKKCRVHIALERVGRSNIPVLIFPSLSLTNRADWKPLQKLVYLVPNGKMNSAGEYCAVKFNKCVKRQPYYYCN